MLLRSNTSDADKQKYQLFWITYLVTITIVIIRGPSFEVPFWSLWNDDTMRLIQVRDLMNGQNWFDLMQYRLGAEGTPMHWSRLIDVPIAALIGFFSIFTSSDWAEAITMVLWPLLLIGPTLCAIYIASIRFGGEFAGIFGLIFGAIAIVSSEKFDPGSLDHHNVQLMLTAVTLMAMMASKNTIKNGVIAGSACALSLSIGFETMLFVFSVSVSAALIFVLYGPDGRNRTVGFTGGFILTLAIAFIVVRPDLTSTTFNCDAFGLDLLVMGTVGASGLLVLASMLSTVSVRYRALGVLVLTVAVLLVAIGFAPACLENPLNQLYPDVRTEWLGRIVESQSLMESINTNVPGNFGLLITPLVAFIFVLQFARNPEKRASSLVLIAVIASAYLMTFYQIRGINFLVMLCVVPIAAFLGHLHERYKITRSPISGVLVILAVILSVPDVWSIGYFSIANPTRLPPAAEFEGAGVAPLVNGGFELCWHLGEMAELANLPIGFIVSSTDLGAVLLSTTPHRVLSSNFHRNQDGIQSGLDLAKSDLNDARILLQNLGVDYVVLCKSDSLPLRLSHNNPDGLWHTIYSGNTPDFLELATDPSALIAAYKVLR